MWIKKQKGDKENMNGLELIIAQNGETEGVYMHLPITRNAFWKKLNDNGIKKSNWQIVGVKTGDNDFADTILASRNLDELNYLGFFMSQFSDEEYNFFFELCNANCVEDKTVTCYINLAANIKNHFKIILANTCDKLGLWVLYKKLGGDKEKLKEVLDSMEPDLTEIGLEFLQKHDGRFSNQDFYGKHTHWRRVYTGDIQEIPEHFLLDSIRI